MNITETKLKGCFIIEPTVFKDERGYFYETFNKQKFKELTSQEVNFVQDIESFFFKRCFKRITLPNWRICTGKIN